MALNAASEELLEAAGRAPLPPVSPLRVAPRAPLLLALDPSMKCTGALVVDPRTRALVEAAACVTDPDLPVMPLKRNGKRAPVPALIQVRDEARRGAEARAFVCRLLERHPAIAAVALEAPLGSQDAGAAAQLARANQATFDAIEQARPALVLFRRVMFVSSYAAKEAATGTRKPEDPKGDVRRAVRRLWGPSAWDRVLVHLTTDRQREAVYDAAAVALCALEQPLVRALIEDLTREEKRP